MPRLQNTWFYSKTLKNANATIAFKKIKWTTNWSLSSQGLINKLKLYLFVVELLPRKRLFAILHGLVFQKIRKKNKNNRSVKPAAGSM